jgi:hypothetical protein
MVPARVLACLGRRSASAGRQFRYLAGDNFHLPSVPRPRRRSIRQPQVVIRWLASVGRSRQDLLLENLSLRQQLATMVQRNRPRIRPADRVFWIALRRVWSRWAEVLVIVKPETVVSWHRAGFRLYWQRLSRRG